MPDDMKAVVERVERDLVVLRLIDWTVIEGERCVGDMISDLRALLSERRKMVEALENARSIMRIVSDAVEDEGDRTYFGSSNHADWLAGCAQETEAFLFGIQSAALTGSREQEADHAR